MRFQLALLSGPVPLLLEKAGVVVRLDRVLAPLQMRRKMGA